MKICLYIFQKNHRLYDNPSLYYAYKNFDRVIPIVIYKDKANGIECEDRQEMGLYRKKFLTESVLDLEFQLVKEGIDLIILRDDEDLEKNIREICKVHHIHHTITSYPRGFIACELLGMVSQFTSVYTCEDDSLLQMEDLPFPVHQLPDTFTSFRKKVEKSMVLRELIPKPLFSPYTNQHGFGVKIEPLNVDRPDMSSFLLPGGEIQGLKQLNYYIWESESIVTYKKTRNSFFGSDFSSKFSPFLAVGNLSANKVHGAIKEFEEMVTKNESTYWLIFELLWREFFFLVSEKYRHRIFLKGGIQNKKVHYQNDKSLLEKWRSANTDDDLVNANMKELISTGYMSNRGRQIVASYLIHDLNIDWRYGATFFEKHLIDYDVTQNWCNWMYIAGVGNDTRAKGFDLDFQKKRYDPSSTYTSQWKNVNIKSII